jgi:hypothetical protein
VFAAFSCAIVMLGLAAILIAHSSRNPVPIYQGKDYFAWLAQLQSSLTNYSDPDRWRNNQDSTTALRAMGTNALTLALADIHAHATVKDRLVMWLGPRLPFLKLQRPDFQARWIRGIRALEVLSPLPKSCLPELIYETTNNVGYGGGALIAVGPDAIPALTNILATSTFPLTGNLIGYFANAIYSERIKTSDAAATVPSLVKVFQSSDWHGRWYAASALGAIHADPDICVPLLVSGMADPQPSVRNASVQALGHFGEAAGPYAGRIAELYDQADPNSRRIICSTFGNFASQGEAVVPVLLKGIVDSNDTVRIAAASSLGQVHAQPDQSIPALKIATKDPSLIVRLQAVQSIGFFGTLGTNALQVLEEARLDADASVRNAATNALNRINLPTPNP